jgi:hypothetical protein
MDGFKSLPKMQCFKEGGAVKYKSKHSESKEMEKDVAKDKQIVKKAFKIHDVQSHEGEKTDLAKLKKGGRMKKCGGGNVRKYKAGGSVTGGSDVAKDGGKKTGGADIKTGQKTGGADIKTGKKTGGSDVAKDGGAKSMGLNNAFKKGGKVKKMADGGMSGLGAVSDYERDTLKRAMGRGPAASGMSGQGAVSDYERDMLKRSMGRGQVTDEEAERMPRGPLPQELTDKIAQDENARDRGAMTDAARKIKRALMGRKQGGKAC